MKAFHFYNVALDNILSSNEVLHSKYVGHIVSQRDNEDRDHSEQALVPSYPTIDSMDKTTNGHNKAANEGKTLLIKKQQSTQNVKNVFAHLGAVVGYNGIKDMSKDDRRKCIIKLQKSKDLKLPKGIMKEMTH